MFASYRLRLMVLLLGLLGLLALVNALSATKNPKTPKDYPADCTPVPTPPGCIPPPEWTPRLAFTVPSMPVGGGSVPMPGYIPPPLPGELYITVPITWDVYQATVTYIAGTNPQTIYGNFGLIHTGMTYGSSFVAHLTAGPCFVLMRHQVPPPNQPTVLQGLAQRGETAQAGAATSINGTMAACATNKNGQATAGPGDVTIEVF